MEKLIKEITNYKKPQISNPQMFIWLLLPIFALIIVTHYFFEKPNNEVLGMGAMSKPVVLSANTKSFKLNTGGVISLLFTGSHRNQYELAYPLLNSKGYLASVSIPTGEVGLPGSMTWLNIRLLESKGWEIISQSRSQICDKTKLGSTNALDNEIVGSKNDLSNMGLTAEIYLPSCGITTPDLINEVKNNYNGLITFGIDPNKLPLTDKYNLITRQVNNQVSLDDVIKWINDAKQNNTWLILSFPDISDVKNDNDVSLKMLTSTLDKIQKSGIRLALPKEVLNYEN